MSVRGRAIVLMGKNTTIRKVFSDYLNDNMNHPCSALLPYIRGNVGFVFTNEDVNSIRKEVLASQVPAPARPGAVAPIDVWVEPGPTGCDPGQTSWFQAMNVPTKIMRGQIEISSRVQMVVAGEKVSDTAAALLDKLNIKPFSYGVVVTIVFSGGVCFDPIVLDLSETDLLNKFRSGAAFVAALGLAIGYPTIASLPHSITNAFKNLMAITLETEYNFPKADDFLNAASAAASAAAAAPADSGAAAPAAAEESSSASSAGGAGDLFGGSDSDSDSSS